MKKEIINTSKAPSAIGPYSQAVKLGDLVFLSGQLPINSIDNTIPEGIRSQTKQVLENISAILASLDLSMDNVVKTTIFLKNLENFNIVNEEYSLFFKSNYPARSTVEVARLPKDVLIEIELIASL
jgi:2-iminobutanoate/2-iminopropanoate deaminase